MKPIRTLGGFWYFSTGLLEGVAVDARRDPAVDRGAPLEGRPRLLVEPVRPPLLLPGHHLDRGLALLDEPLVELREQRLRDALPAAGRGDHEVDDLGARHVADRDGIAQRLQGPQQRLAA